MVDNNWVGANVSAYVNDGEVTDDPNRVEIELKLSKIKNMIQSIDERILVHERKLQKLYKIDEREETKNIISKLTQKILSSS